MHNTLAAYWPCAQSVDTCSYRLQPLWNFLTSTGMSTTLWSLPYNCISKKSSENSSILLLKELLRNCPLWLKASQGAFQALRPEELAFQLVWWSGYSLNYTLWHTKMQILMHSSFDLCTSDLQQPLTLAYTPRSYWHSSGVSSTWNAPL